MDKTQELINGYVSNPNKLLYKKPFTRGLKINNFSNSRINDVADYNEKVSVELPDIRYVVIPQQQFMAELDENRHSVLFDSNVPSICAKNESGGYTVVDEKKMGLSIQRNILDKKVLHLCANPMTFTIMNENPSKAQESNFVKFKQYWNLRNQDGMKTKMVAKQCALSDSGLLYHFDRKGRIKSRIIAFPDYTLIPINDKNGDRLLESMFYQDGNIKRLDTYSDTYIYRFVYDLTEINVVDNSTTGWRLEEIVPHGFSEIPLITKRGYVAWNNVQSIIEIYEIVYNIYSVIQKRQGWGILFINGSLKPDLKKLNGPLILESKGLDADKTDAKYLTPPTGEGMEKALEKLEEQIQKGAGYTSILPKDIKSMGDISGVAIQMTKELDIETALQGVIEWQNVADKMTRLFKEGLAKELVNNGVNPIAITEFEDLQINAKFSVWRPQSDTEYNNMLIALKQAGLLSEETGIEKNTESPPDEKARRNKEKEEELKKAMETNASVQDINVNKTTNVTEE